jgi:glucokinase
MNYLGIEIGGSKLQLVTGTGDGDVVDRQQLAVDRSLGGAGIRGQIESEVRRLQPLFQWNAVGVGYGGPVDWTTGRICCSHHVPGWEDFPLGEWLRELTGIPVAVDNDTNVAGFGESQRGAGVGKNPVFYTNSGSGVGGGLVVDGKIYHGAKPGEAEFGHLRLDTRGTIVEERCSGWAVDKQVLEITGREPASILARFAAGAGGSEARALGPALAANCPFARQILNRTAADLAFALSHVVHLFHPEVIVLGGGLALIGEPWRAAVAAAVPRFVMAAFAPGPSVELTALGENAVPAGALLLAKTARESSNNQQAQNL